MKVLSGILSEIWGLFVEDGSYAVAIAIWLAIVGFGLSRLPINGFKGPLLFTGLALVLIENVRRTAAKKKS